MNKSHTKPTQLRYIAYVRKSDEREERQQLSHAAQVRKIKEQFPDLNIVKWMPYESKSAFKPGRKIFNDTLRLIDGNKADGLIFYSPNRASRNEIDAAAITYRLRDGHLKDLRFCTYTFENSNEGILMLQMLLSQSQYESAKQGKDVKRGMVQKAISGERPGIVPQGYMKITVLENGVVKKVKDKIITETGFDPDRIDLVRKMWKMLLSEAYTPRQIIKIANEKWDYRTRQTKKTGGKHLTLSGLYRIFHNPFYAGWILHEGEWHKGNHEAIISVEEYDRAQKILGKRGKARTDLYEYAYTGLMKCGKCGCSVVAKSRDKKLANGKLVTYVYYYCSRKSEQRPCNQVKYTRLADIERDIDAELSKYTIMPEFRDLALNILNREHKIEVKERNQIMQMHTSKRQSVQNQLDSLIDMRTRDLLDDDEYMEQKSRLKQLMIRIEEDISSIKVRETDWLELTEKVFDFATYARIHYRQGDTNVKRQILMSLGQNFTLLDNKLTINPSEWLLPIGKGYPAIEADYLRRVGTNKKATPKKKEMALASVSEDWRARRGSNPRHPA